MVIKAETLATFFIVFCLCFWSFDIPLFDSVNYLGIIVFVLWAFSIGFYGQEQIDQLGLKRMNVPLLVINSVFVLVIIVAVKFYNTLPTGISEVMDLALPVLILMAIIAGLHTLLFAAKTLAKIECQREVRFNDYFTNFLLMGIFIWGIWVLQPKVNKLAAIPHPTV